MIYRHLGSSGIMVSPLAFGAWQIGDPKYWGTDAESDAETAVRTALDHGINLFDTAEAYGEGESERALARALGGRRNEAILATKVSPQHCAPRQLRSACEASLKRLKTTHIDLYQVHWPFRHVPSDEASAELLKLRDEGKIRAIGLSNFGPRDLSQWMAHGEATANQIGYNLLARGPEQEAIPATRRHGLALLAYMPLMQGLLSGRWTDIGAIPASRRRIRHFASTREGTRHGEEGCEDLLMETLAELRIYADHLGMPMSVMALAWLLAQPAVTSVIVGSRKPKQLSANMAAAQQPLAPADVAILNEITAPLKARLGLNTDLWEGEMHSRIH